MKTGTLCYKLTDQNAQTKNATQWGENVMSREQRLEQALREARVLVAAELAAIDAALASPQSTPPTDTQRDASEEVQTSTPKYGRSAIGSPVGYVDRLTGHARFCRLNDLEHCKNGTKVYAVPDPALAGIRRMLQSMINSVQVFSDGEGVTGYKIKTGMLHRVIGAFADADEPLYIPTNLEEISANENALRDACKEIVRKWRKFAERYMRPWPDVSATEFAMGQRASQDADELERLLSQHAVKEKS